jgi:predicted DNA-binding ribbon-helix-helix protein
MKRRRPLPSRNVKRSIKLDGRNTSVGLEDGFWNALKEIAASQETSVQKLVSKIARRKGPNLSSAVRLFVLDYYRRAASR